MKIALITLATGEMYRKYAWEMMASAAKYLPQHDQFTFTDDESVLSTWMELPGAWVGRIERNFIYTEPKGYPKETLMRYHTFLQEPRLRKYDQIFYADADMLFVDYVRADEIVSDGLTATLHPGFAAVNRRGTTEKRSTSTACCDLNTAYYCGGFQGGYASAYLLAASQLAQCIDIDANNGITAVWHDESHWNRYLAAHPPARVLNPSFCYPEDYDGGYGWSKEQYPPKLMALDKMKRGMAKRKYENHS